MRWKNLANLLVLLPLTVVISGCSTFWGSTPEPKVVVQTQYVEKNIPIMAAPKPMTLNDVTWYVVTEENFEQFLEKYKKEHGDAWVFYGISVRSYESMALNMAEIKRYIEQQKAIIVYYEEQAKAKTINPIEVTPNGDDGK